MLEDMKTSSYYEKALFDDSTPAIDDYFDTRVGQLFEQSKERSYIEFHFQRPSHQVEGDATAAFDAVSKASEWDLDLGSESTAEPWDQSCHLREPPRYTEAPVLGSKITDVKNLSELAVVSLVIGYLFTAR